MTGVKTISGYKYIKSRFKILSVFPLDKSSVSGVIEQACLLDHMEVEMVDIDLFSAVSFSQEGGMFSYKRQVKIENITCL